MRTASVLRSTHSRPRLGDPGHLLRDQPEALGEGSRFKSPCVRDVNLITGQQQYSGREAAQLVIGAVGR
jgi:hypothetical protein